MLIKAEQKYVRTSPRKLRLVADAIRGVKSPAVAITYLENIGKRAGEPLAKTIKQAVANAKNNMNLPVDSLEVKELQISGGPIYKRWRIASRRGAHANFKRTSHIRVILESMTKTQDVEKKEIKKAEVKVEEIKEVVAEKPAKKAVKKETR